MTRDSPFHSISPRSRGWPNQLPYITKQKGKLQELCKSRRLPCKARDTKPTLASKLDAADRAIKSAVRARINGIASGTHELALRTASLSRLPWEIREPILKDIIFHNYGDAEFNPRLVEWNIYYDEASDAFLPKTHYLNSTLPIAVFQSLATMDLLSTVSAELREQSRAVFFGNAKFRLAGNIVRKPSGWDWTAKGCKHTTVVARFLDQLGSFGRKELRRLDALWPESVEYSQSALQEFKQILAHLKESKNLHEISILCHLGYIFQDDKNALEDYFLHGKALNSQGLALMQDCLSNKNALETISIRELRLSRKTPWHPLPRSSLDPFLIFAFTGTRAKMLWGEILHHLRNNIIASTGKRIHVNFGDDLHYYDPSWATNLYLEDEMDYAKWLQAYQQGRIYR